ncbi:CaiB/BaiF CoA transferase family protein [Psychrobacillus sp. NPDC096426]|uniref:CaiB/BaiF CoA transferase family protein n=1 Tax=Psychrobacillus sp. NPDC096426 TaxID=3364491 RepID=UPI003829A5E1
MLKGIRVIDFSQYLPGPNTTLRLADLGAEIIKIESPSGDPARFPPEKDGGDRYVFRAQNRDKKSVILNLKDPSEQQKARKLIREADVVIESFRPGVVKRLGISYEEIIKEKPDIVYCSLSGYGQEGEMSHLGSHDINYMALSGVLAQFKDDTGRPVFPSTTLADLVGAVTASESIVAALLQKERTGKGSYLDIALADLMSSLMTNHILIESATGQKNGVERLHKKLISYSIYETKDGRFISLGALEPKFWENFCLAMDKEEWIPAHLSAPVETNQVYEEMKNVFLSRNLEQWTLFSQQVDCCMAPVLESGEIADHPYYKNRNLIQERWALKYVSTRYNNGYSLLEHSTPSPKHGEHTDELLKELKHS